MPGFDLPKPNPAGICKRMFPEIPVCLSEHSLVLVEVHAPDGGGVPVERVEALPALAVPHLERAVRAAAHHGVAVHLRAPHAARVTHQRPQALSGGSRPDLKESFIHQFIIINYHSSLESGTGVTIFV